MAGAGKGRSMVVKFEARTDALRRQVAGAETILGRFQKTTSRVGAGMKAAVMSAGGMVTGVTGVAAAATAAAKGAMDFEAQVSKVRATGGATEPQLKALETQAMSMGKTFGVSATDAMQSVEALAKAGVSTQDIMGGGLQGALSLAAAGEMDVGESAETASSAMAQFGLRGRDVGHIADVLAQGANLAQGGVSDLSQALSQGGMVASQMGMSLDETVGVLAEFANKGLQGSDAGTSLKTMLQRLSNPAADAKKQMEKLGIAAYNSSGKFVGLSSFAGQLQTSMQKLTPAQRDAAMSTIFGSDAVRAASILYTDGAKGVSEWTKNVGKSGAAMQTARTNTDNLKGDLDRAKAAFQNAFIVMGESSQGPLRKVVQGFGSIADKAPGAAKAVQEATSSFAASFKAADGDITSSGFNGAVELVGGKLGQAFLKAKDMASGLKPAFDSTGSSLHAAFDGAASLVQGVWDVISPMAADVIKLAGAAAMGALVLAWKALQAVLDVISPVLSAVGGFLSDHQTLIGSLVTIIGTAVIAYRGLMIVSSIAKSFTVMNAAIQFAAIYTKLWTVATKAQSIAQAAMNLVMDANPVMLVVIAIAALAAGFIYAYRHSETFRNIVQGALNGVKMVALAVAGWFAGPFVGFFVGAWSGIKAGFSAIGGFFSGIWDGIRMVFSAGVTAVKGFLTSLWAAFSNTWAFRAMQSLILTGIAIIRFAIQGFVAGVTVIWHGLWAGMQAVASVFMAGLRAVISAGMWVIRNVIQPPLNAVRVVWGAVWGWISSWVSSIFNSIHHNVSVKILQVQMVITRVMNVIKAVWSVGWGAVRDTGTRVMNQVKSAFDRILGGIRGAFSNTVSTIGTIWNGVKKVVGAPITFVVDKIINNGIISAIRKIQGFFGLSGKQQMPPLKVPRFRHGGTVDAPFHAGERDDLLGFTPHGVVRLEGGEHITNRDSTRRSPRLLKAINSGLLTDRIARFRSGGFVGGRGRLTEVAAARIQAAADSLGWTLQLAQRGWNPPNGLSGTSHAGDAVDVSGPAGGTRLWSIRDALRRQSWAAWVRGPKENFSWHVHAIPLAGAGDARGSAIYQRQAYAAGGDGLHGLSARDVYATPSGSGGSWLGQVVASVKSFAERMTDKAKSVFGGLASPVDYLKSKITGLKDSITSKLGGSGWAATLARLPGKLWESGKNWVTSKFKAFVDKGTRDEQGTAGVAGNAESWRPMVQAALRATGIGSGKADEDSWLRQIMTESGGNPNLIQSSALRDINVRNGDPARGLVQVPGVTWADFGKDQGAFLQNWMLPLKNLIVGMRAAAAQHSNWRAVVGHGHGYAGGTISAAPGWAWVGERGPELMRLTGGEQILSAAQSSALTRRSSHIAVANTSSQGPVLSDAQWDELLDAIRDGQSPVVVDGGTLREAIRSEMRLAARQESNRRSVLR